MHSLNLDSHSLYTSQTASGDTSPKTMRILSCISAVVGTVLETSPEEEVRESEVWWSVRSPYSTNQSTNSETFHSDISSRHGCNVHELHHVEIQFFWNAPESGCALPRYFSAYTPDVNKQILQHSSRINTVSTFSPWVWSVFAMFIIKQWSCHYYHGRLGLGKGQISTNFNCFFFSLKFCYWMCLFWCQ